MVAAAATTAAAAAGAEPCRPQRRGAGERRPEPRSGARLPAVCWRPGAPLASLALAYVPYGAAASSSPVLRHLRLQGSGMPLSLGSGSRGSRLLSSSASPSPPPTSQRTPERVGRAGPARGPRRRGFWRTEDLRRVCANRGAAPDCAGAGAGLAPSAAPARRGAGGGSDHTAVSIRRGPANVGAAAPAPPLLTPPGRCLL